SRLDEVLTCPKVKLKCHNAGISDINEQPFGSVFEYNFFDSVFHIGNMRNEKPEIALPSRLLLFSVHYLYSLPFSYYLFITCDAWIFCAGALLFVVFVSLLLI